MMMNRRELIRSIAAGTVTFFVVPSFITSCEEDLSDPDNINNDPNKNGLTINLIDTKYKSLGSAGGFIVEGNIIILNTGDEYIALSSVCTHRGCEISYDHSSSNLPCPCHGSIFSTSGSVLNGPAETSLKKFNVARDGDILTIT